MLIYLIVLSSLAQVIYLMNYVVIEMCYLRVQDNIKYIKGIPIFTPAIIDSYINYANTIFLVAGIFIFFYIILHAVFSIRYWALSKKIENIINKVGNEK